MVAKSFRHPKHCLEVLASRSSGLSTLIGRPCDLIQVPADRAQLRHRPLQCQQLLLGKRRQIAQVRPDQDGHVGGRTHTPGRRPVAQQDPILRRQAGYSAARPGSPSPSASSFGNPSFADMRSMTSRSCLTSADSVICSRSASTRRSVFISGVTRHCTKGVAAMST